MKRYRIIYNESKNYEVQTYSGVVNALSNSDGWKELKIFSTLGDAENFLAALKEGTKNKNPKIKIIKEVEF